MAQPIHYRYDTFSPRIIAAIIDGVVIIAPAILLQYLLDMVSVFWVSFFFGIFTDIAIRAYFILGHGLYGRTVGKKTQNVRVVDFLTEQPITMIQAFRRELWFIILAAIGLTVSMLNDFVLVAAESTRLSLSYAFMFLAMTLLIAQVAYCLNSPKRRAIHDLIGGTVVVRDDVSIDDR